MGKRSITAEDLYRFRIASDPQVSPDGQRIAFVVKTIERETNTYHTAIWVAPVTEGFGAAQPFTSDGSQPRWSPDGSHIAFVSERTGPLPEPGKDVPTGKRDKRMGKGKGQVWVIPAYGGEARQVTFAEQGASDPVWSPDGTRILFAAQVGDFPEVPEHDGKPEPRVHHIKELIYRFNGPGYIYQSRSHLFVVPVAGGAATQLTDGDWNDGAAAWSPDGSQIAFESDRHADRWRMMRGEIWLMNADGSNQHAVLAEESFNYFSPAWSPDSQQLAVFGLADFGSGGHADVFVLRPGASPRNLTEYATIEFDDAIGGDMRNDHADATPRWAPDGQSLYLVGQARGATNVVQLTLDGALSAITSGQHHLVGFSVDRAGNTFALALADTQQPGDIFAYWRDSGDTMRLTDLNHDLLSEMQLSQPEEFTFTGAKGWEIEGWILKPVDFDASKQYPLILEIHGGPETAYGYTLVLEFQLLVAQGYVVVYSNPRGSTGYGREFTQAVRGIWGQEDYQDMMAAVDAVVARGYIDEERLGVTGGSYGGIMTNWIVGHSDRFRAAVTQRSISNLATFFGTSDVGPWYSINHWEGAPWQTPERHAFHSPITYVTQIHTPLLIIHSEQDWRCPISEAEQLFAALKWLRRDTEFLRFDGSNHDLSRNGHPRLRIDRLNAIQDWFLRYIPAGPTPDNGQAHANVLNGDGDLADLEPASSHI